MATEKEDAGRIRGFHMLHFLSPLALRRTCVFSIGSKIDDPTRKAIETIDIVHYQVSIMFQPLYIKRFLYFT